jgi:hypothetical protein
VLVFNVFEELFAPGHQHTSDERNRLETTRDDVGDSDPGCGPIDLDSGLAIIRPPVRTEEEPGTGDDGDGGDGDAEG